MYCNKNDQNGSSNAKVKRYTGKSNTLNLQKYRKISKIRKLITKDFVLFSRNDNTK